MSQYSPSIPKVEEVPSASLKSNAWCKSFPTTLWTQVIHAKEGNQPSLEDFYRRYATPVYCYFRAKKVDQETAKDLTQDLFVKLSNGKLLGHLQPRRHRFRFYLIKAARNQWIDYLKKKRCELDRRIGPLDEVLESISPRVEPSSQVSPEEAYQRRAAQALLDEVILRVQQECRSGGLSVHFSIFAARHLENKRHRWEQIGKRHGVSGQKASNMARTVSERFRQMLYNQIKLECREHEEVEEEIRHFIAAFNVQTSTDELSDEMPDMG